MNNYYYILQYFGNNKNVLLSNKSMIISNNNELTYKFELLQDLNFNFISYPTDIYRIRLIAVKKTNKFIYNWNELYNYLTNSNDSELINSDLYTNILELEFNMRNYDIIPGVITIYNNTNDYIMYFKVRYMSVTQYFISHPYIEINKNYLNQVLHTLV
jgi:hypothetical protein